MILNAGLLLVLEYFSRCVAAFTSMTDQSTSSTSGFGADARLHSFMFVLDCLVCVFFWACSVVASNTWNNETWSHLQQIFLCGHTTFSEPKKRKKNLHPSVICMAALPLSYSLLHSSNSSIQQRSGGREREREKIKSERYPERGWLRKWWNKWAWLQKRLLRISPPPPNPS